MLQPSILTHHSNPILTNIHHDNAKTHNRRGYKQTLGGMQKARPKRAGVKVKPAGYHSNIEQKEREIEQEEYAAQGIQAVEAKRHGVQHVGDPARGHGQAEPRPCEVADAFAPGEFSVPSGFWIVEVCFLGFFGLLLVGSGDVAVST
jgi:hypothetical protein